MLLESIKRCSLSLTRGCFGGQMCSVIAVMSPKRLVFPTKSVLSQSEVLHNQNPIGAFNSWSLCDIFWSYPSDDRLWRKTLNHGNSELPVHWYCLACHYSSCDLSKAELTRQGLRLKQWNLRTSKFLSALKIRAFSVRLFQCLKSNDKSKSLNQWADRFCAVTLKIRQLKERLMLEPLVCVFHPSQTTPTRSIFRGKLL